MWKQRKGKRILIASAALILTAAAATGCSGGKKDGNDGSAANVKIQVVKPAQASSVKYPDGMDDNTNPYSDYIRSSTGLDIEITAYPSEGSAYVDKLNVLLASSDLPDMMVVPKAEQFISFLNQKALKPLNEAIDKYGSDLMKQIPQEAWDGVTIDGKIYAVPRLGDTEATQLMYVRKDWLDNLGLQAPKTLEDYAAVAKAFAEADPDGNGKADTVGLLAGENLDRLGPFLGAFGVQQGIWMERNGELVNGSILPEMKQALTYLNGLYKDKVLDQEWALNKQTTINEKIGGGKAGLFSARWQDTRTPILANKKSDPKADWIPIGYPTGPEGKSGIALGNKISQYMVVPATSSEAEAEAVVKMLNFIVGEGFSSIKNGFENEVWTKKDGKVVIDEEQNNLHLYRLGLAFAQPGDPNLKLGRLQAIDDGDPQFKLVENINTILKNGIPDLYTGLPTDGMGEYGAKLSSLENETFTKMIMGVIPLDDFDKFVAQWKKDGGDEITQEVNEWYKNKNK
ncbi:extracellular solute-binding protein [Paenibacillus sp. HB172176]|uniref:extracellular solute-binding protein n=1 Tax=Paenibacillus sp. HB172176 TaxID=2493690 RepID=UPI00143C998E|nr:extracellular solute-binding protein [Paenibacillus sp. HB172176]